MLSMMRTTPRYAFSEKKRIVRAMALKFTRCPRKPCYCDELISRPDKTKITSELIINANKCHKEYFIMQNIIERENVR